MSIRDGVAERDPHLRREHVLRNERELAMENSAPGSKIRMSREEFLLRQERRKANTAAAFRRMSRAVQSTMTRFRESLERSLRSLPTPQMQLFRDWVNWRLRDEAWMEMAEAHERRAMIGEIMEEIVGGEN